MLVTENSFLVETIKCELAFVISCITCRCTKIKQKTEYKDSLFVPSMLHERLGDLEKIMTEKEIEQKNMAHFLTQTDIIV